MGNYSYTVTLVPKLVFGENVILDCKKHLEPFGKKFAFVMGCGPITGYVTERVNQSFKDSSGFKVDFIDNNDNPINYRTIDILADKITALAPDAVIAVGGGKTLDIVRAQARKTNTPVVLCPTLAATNAGGTTMAVIFNDDNSAIEEFVLKPFHHELTILDTDLVIKAPPRTLVAGIGDALGSYYEGIATAKQKNRNIRCSALMWAGFYEGVRCLRETGVQAVAAAKAGETTLAFEQAVENIIIGNGMFGMAANGGMSVAHIVADETLVYLGCEHRFLHGELVGYAVLPTMIWDNYSLDEIHKYIDYCLAIGLPTTMDELGIGNITDAELMAHSVKALKDGWIPRFTDVTITAKELAGSMRTADNVVKQYLSMKK